jgi:hypothetical protein
MQSFGQACAEAGPEQAPGEMNLREILIPGGLEVLPKQDLSVPLDVCCEQNDSVYFLNRTFDFVALVEEEGEEECRRDENEL